MRKMKRVVVGLLALGMAFTMTACGGKEQTVTYRGEVEESGLKATDTMTFTAKGDTVEKLNEVIEFDISSFDDSVKELTDKGLLDMSGGDGSGKISLEASGASLEANGYEKVE